MDQQREQDGHVRKRRAIHACVACRGSKVRCDGQRPCARCSRNDTECRYFEHGSSSKDVIAAAVQRLEKLEAEVESLRNIVSASHRQNAMQDNMRRGGSSAASLIGGTATTAMDVDVEVPARRRDGSETVIAYGTTRMVGRTQETRGEFELGPTPNQVMGVSPTPTATTTTSTQVLHGLIGGAFTHLLAGDEGPSSSPATAVNKGLISWEQASFYFQSFFSGSHFLVPIFCAKTDTLQSVASRSAYLFDSIVSIGCRAEEGSKSATYHRLSLCLREHLTRVLVSTTMPSLETVQAITLKAGYSDDGLVYLALTLRFSMLLGLPDAVEKLVAKASSRGAGAPVGDEEKELYRLGRVWHGICNMELFFSLDGGKSPAITLRISSRRVRLLVNHPERTAVDFRLLSQIELNIIRANAYTIITQQHSSTSLASEIQLRSTVQGTAVELALWLEEWSEIISSGTKDHTREMALLNLRIQYNWALITLHLKALSNSGIESIAIMTEFQRDMVRIAKEAAVRHLHSLLETPRTSSSSPASDSPPPYLSVFKWTMDFVWAKCAFTVLLVLKLSLLLRDPLPDVLLLLRDAYRVLEELTRVTVSNSGNTSYLKILRTSIEKCESALREHMVREQQLSIDDVEREDGQAEDDFQGYVPSQFVFEWDFPGLNLRHVPLGWHDLFHDLDRVF